MVFAPKKLAVRTAPVLNNRVGASVTADNPFLGQGYAYPKALKPAYAESPWLDAPRPASMRMAATDPDTPPPAAAEATAMPPQQHRAAPALPPAAATHRPAPSLSATAASASSSSSSRFEHTTSIARPETVTRAMERALPASVGVRDMAYRLRPALEAMLGFSLLKFDAASYKLMSIPTKETSVEDRLARAVEQAAAHRMALQARGGDWDFGVPPPRLPPFRTNLDASKTPFVNPHKPHPNYFAGLKSQQPIGKAHVYFIKVDAAWYGGYAYIHLRVRSTATDSAPERLGIPSAIPPLEESKLVLEGVRTNYTASSPLEPFPPTMSLPIAAVHDHHARLRRGPRR